MSFSSAVRFARSTSTRWSSGLVLKERDHINALLRSCTKVALCLSPSTSTARLLNLGTHNTFEELVVASLTAQLTRLSGTATGRALLFQLGIPRSPILLRRPPCLQT
ncbi:hypothetical protein HPB49_000649 [Dermacentor silvarum]|uniref:Uncharacterized protein n=1 Tax=Dermacentor silvarum TaxID=543639 RepID=A0ACB8D1H3_DERSI|nr:hypothetical protein HPB49_000649 [Dermacentor silvarum]